MESPIFEVINPEINPEKFGFKQIVPLRDMQRFTGGGQRFYIEDVNGVRQPYSSVTMVTGETYPVGAWYTKWVLSLGGQQNADYARDSAGWHGTELNRHIVQFMETGILNIDAARSETYANCMQSRFAAQASEYAELIGENLLSFAIFCSERNVKFITAGMIVRDRSAKMAGYLDAVMEFDFGKKRVAAIFDYKRKVVGEALPYAFQLMCYRKMWNQMYRDVLPVSHIFNWSPLNPTNKEPYKLTNQAEAINEDLFEAQYHVASMQNFWQKCPKKQTIIGGQWNMKDAFSLENFVTVHDIW